MNTYSVTDLRHKTNEVISAAQAKGYVHIIRKAKTPIAVIDSDYLTTLQETYEDYLDLQEIERVKGEPTITLEEHLRKYTAKHK